MSLFLAKKQEDLNQKKVRDLLRLKENKKCFDCPTKSPFFVNTTIQTFICARCSGLVREVGHRVKAISASKFSGAELIALKQGGNGIALKIWLSNYSTHDSPEPESDDDIRAFMRQKYYENKWLDQSLLHSHKEKVGALIAKQFNEDGLPIITKSRTKLVPGFARVPLIPDNEKDEDDINEFDQDSIAIPTVSSSTPVITIPECNNPISSTIPPIVSPTGRESMESTYSTFSAKSSASMHSQHQEDYVSSNRRSVGSKRSVTSERNSMDSTGYSSSSSAPSSNAGILTAEEIAERCRSSIESKAFIDQLVAKEETVTESPATNTPVQAPVQTFVQTPINKTEQKVASLQINVAQANNDFAQFQKHQHQQHLKSPTLVNYGNGLQSSAPKHTNASAPPIVTPSTSKPLLNAFDSIIMELSGLKLEKTVRRPTYTGGMLSPASTISTLSPSSSTSALTTPEDSKSRPTSMFDPSVFSHVATNATPENDPYAALRGIPAPVVVIKEEPKEVKEIKEFDFPQSDEDDDDPWQEFCSSSSVDENEHIQAPAQVIQPIMENKPMVTMDIFSDLDPLAMFRRF